MVISFGEFNETRPLCGLDFVFRVLSIVSPAKILKLYYCLELCQGELKVYTCGIIDKTLN